MNDRNPPDEFTGVNEAVGEEWEAETTPYERIRHVVAHTYSPVSADAVADDARTAPKTARKHLNTLADEGFVETIPGEQGGTRSIGAHLNHSSSNRLPTFLSMSRPMNSSPEFRRCASNSPSIGPNSVLIPRRIGG